MHKYSGLGRRITGFFIFFILGTSKQAYLKTLFIDKNNYKGGKNCKICTKIIFVLQKKIDNQEHIGSSISINVRKYV